ncbi:MAG: LPS-assembly protein LptD [Syntrophobacteraceae bacterium]|nr:LPS-assembly protein LptD [Syntrophobacteraceae bacterium]
MLRAKAIRWTLVCVLCWFGASAANPASGMADQTKTQLFPGLGTKKLAGPPHLEWKIEAAHLTYDQNRNTYEAWGEVRITAPDRIMLADWAELNGERRQVELWGNVYLQYRQDWLRGEHIVWNLDHETGCVDGGLAYFSQNKFYVSGERISKVGPQQFELKNGFLTSCDPADSDWKIRYDRMKVDIGGQATARDTSFWVRNVPIFYLPYLRVPVLKERQSGFLLPWAQYSDLNGMGVEVPFYWAIRQDMDLTLYGRYMEERGWMSGAEFRLVNERWGEGIWQANYLRDQADKGHLEHEGYPFEQKDRYWVRARHNFQLPDNIEGRLDLDLVSDKNFLNEFRGGSVSYSFSDRAFQDHFGRGLLFDKGSVVRESSLYLDQRHDSALLAMDVRYWDQLEDSKEDVTLQKMPTLYFNMAASEIPNLPFYYTLDSSLTNYWRRDGDRGTRLDLLPRLHYPMHWRNYLDIEPSFGVRSTSYWVDWEQSSRSQWQEHFFPDVRVEMSSRVNRVYPMKIGNFVAVQHAFRPEFSYEYAPQGYQGFLPRFDRLDQDLSRNDFRYGFSTFLTTKESLTNAQGNPVSDYREIARFKIFQTYHIEKPPEVVQDRWFNPDPQLDMVSTGNEGFGEIGMRLDVMPKRYLTLSYDTTISPDQGDVLQQDVLMTLDSGRGHVMRLDYRYRKDVQVDEIIPQLYLKVIPNVFFTTYHDYSLDKADLFSQGYGVLYQSGCWGVGLMYEKEDRDQRIAFSVNLLGIGTLGGIRTYRGEGLPGGMH